MSANDKKKNKGGRPTKWKDEYVEQVYKLCALGATDIEIADFFSVHPDTIANWKHDYPSFFEALKKGKDKYDQDAIEGALRQRALGFSHEEDKIFNDGGRPLIVPTTKHYPPDTTALIFWLKNRDQNRWRDKRDIDHTTNGKEITSIVREVVDKVDDADNVQE